MKNKVFGVGVNDADYVVQPTVIGRRAWCQFYQSWHGMLKRCYNGKFQQRCQTYIGCIVTPEWHSFMAFRAWMLTQDHEGKELDKDILSPGNKVYSPDTCVFVDHAMNTFLIDSGSARGDWPIGVTWAADRKKFRASCNNPFTSRQENLGGFMSPEAAHEAWRKRKHDIACQYADMQTDPRISLALRTRYATQKDAA